MSSQAPLYALPHHDGSERYLSSLAPKLGDKVTFKFRASADLKIEKAILRLYHDGEPRFFPMIKGVKGREQWWQARVKILNPKTPYRFLIVNGEHYSWLNAQGFHSNDVTSTHDFHLLATPEFPKWIRSSVFYQIFPDRFATSGKYRSLMPKEFVVRDWSDLPKGRHKTTGVEYFGGDMDGVAQNLSHIQKLGANGIYFTPFFPARSTHRYDASSFDEVDPLLGGNPAFLRLLKIARNKKIHIMGDLTTNHCGAGHPWIKKALANKKAKEREFFYWDRSVKHGYEGWWGLASLPKLNYNSKKLRDLMYSGKGSIVKKWLGKPFSLSGWRIDVGNMTGRYRGEDMNREVILGIRQAVQATNYDAWLLAENADHFPADLDGFGWHGTMNYNGFMRPVWGWLKHQPQVDSGFFGVPVEVPRFSGKEMVAAMKEFSSTIPWRNFVSSMLLLDSHDTARFRNVVGTNSKLHLSGMGLLLTYPGVPSIFAGDEIGVQGAWGEDARRTIDWSGANWDHDFFNEVRKLVKIRRNSHALAHGGLRWLVVEDDAIAFIRESSKESVLVVITRKAVQVALPLIEGNITTVYGADLFNGVYRSPDASVGIYRVS
ncbi:MAG: glycoside hydrolase family 13 protein [Candidatus Nanopelagicaceae bacterium]